MARMKENAYINLVETPEEKLPLDRPSRIIDGNIKMELKQDSVEWIYMAQGRKHRQAVVSTVTNSEEFLDRLSN